jgi:hypothetical protein
MGKLQGAYGSTATYEKTTLKIDREGDFQAYFIGLTKPWTETSNNYSCKLCKGEGTGRNGEPEGCVRCNGSGKRVEQKTKLRYEMRHGIEEEVVSFKLAPPGNYNGKATKASTMYLRFARLADLPQATPEQLDQWFSTLPEPCRVPCMVRIEYNDTGDALVIKGVRLRQAPHANGHALRELARQEPPASRFDGPATAAEPEEESWTADQFEDSIPF